jgi:double-stranded uracil-DNA glycosylase
MGFIIEEEDRKQKTEVRMKTEEVKAWRPTREQLLAAEGKSLPDLIRPKLKVLFCGINPGLYTAAVGHHFARPGNRFWPALYMGGFTPRVLSPFEEKELLPLGYGIANVVDRATVAADVLTRQEYEEGAKILQAKVKMFKPKWLAILGVGAYRAGFNRKDAKLGSQEEMIGETKIWVLPNPSGLNAHHTPESLGKLFMQLHDAVEAS